ncbi:DUF4148 domain-containing protein [Bordetella sp. 2513F-2]
MKTHLRIPSLIAAATLAGLAGLAQAQEETPPQASHSSQSREAVRADLQAWRESGLGDAWHGESTPSLDSAAYREMQQRYAQATQRSQYARARTGQQTGGES